MQKVKSVLLLILEIVMYLLAFFFLVILLIGIEEKDLFIIVLSAVLMVVLLILPANRCSKRLSRKIKSKTTHNNQTESKSEDQTLVQIESADITKPAEIPTEANTKNDTSGSPTSVVGNAQYQPLKSTPYMTNFRKTALKELLICLFFGWCGAHKFRQQKYFQFVIYLLSMGFFFIGWGFDTILFLVEFLAGKVIFKVNKPRNKTIPTRTLSPDEPLPVVTGDMVVMLTSGEICHYCEITTYLTSKNMIVGYTGGHSGASIRVAKGLTLRTGGSRSVPIREDVFTETKGVLTITNKRIIFTSHKESFDRKLTAISAVLPSRDGVEIRFGNSYYLFKTNDQMYIHQIVSRILQTIEV